MKINLLDFQKYSDAFENGNMVTVKYKEKILKGKIISYVIGANKKEINEVIIKILLISSESYKKEIIVIKNSGILKRVEVVS